MRKKIVAGNWKMNKTLGEAGELLRAISADMDKVSPEVEVVIIPPFPYLPMAAEVSEKNEKLQAGAQNCYWEEEGAFTGEVSPKMIKSTGCKYVLVGHSERRKYFGESDEQLFAKINAVIGNGLVPVYCCGESLEDRNAGNHFSRVEDQIRNGLFRLSKEDFEKIVIAYEPLWAIGTGLTAKPSQAQEMHKHIRNTVAGKYDAETAENLTILYGGSCKPANATELFACEDVDGGLIGGASLKAGDFMAIANSF